MTEPARLRIAPSPTGDPHVGTAYQALFDKAYARKTGGAFVLRIEDTDRVRLVEGSEEQIYDTLAWLGLDADESPQVGGPYAPYKQSERLDTYRPYVDQLIADGHAYYCWCTPERLAEMRAEQEAAKSETVGYDRLCYGKAKEERAQLPGFQENPVVRMLIPDDVELEFDDAIGGRLSAPRPDDQVILKADGFPTYHLAVVVDDHLMGITHMVRGQEWISSTPKQLLLYRWLGWETPTFAHTPLIRNTDRSKLGKRKSPWAKLTWFRGEGYLPEALLNFLMLLGYPPLHEGDDVQTFDEFVADFDWAKINPAGAIFDIEKLKWLNGHYIRTLAPAELGERIVEFLRAGGREVTEEQARVYAAAAPLVQERLVLLGEAEEKLAFLFLPHDAVPVADDARASLPDNATEVVSAAVAALEGLDEFTAEPIQAALRAALVDSLGLKPKLAFGPVRVALTGSKVSPPLFESMEILGRDATLTRLRAFSA